jgi:hypothetical protein
MNRARLFTVLLSLGAAGLARAADIPAGTSPTAPQAPAKPPVTPALPPRFQQVRDRIDALFHYRVSTPTTLDAKQNPFRPAGAFVPAVTASDGRSVPTPVEQPATDQTLLQEAAATLKVGGVFEIRGKQHRTVNGRPYKEGDIIPTQVQGQALYLKIKTLGPKSMTLVFKEAETTLNF